MIDFQPMPKRFMVWDKEAHDFVKGVNGFILTWREIANLVEPTVWDCATELDEIAERFTVIQSANLYAGNNEVFEGSLLQTDKEAFNVGVDVNNYMPVTLDELIRRKDE